VTADQAANWAGTTGVKTIPLVSAAPVVAGKAYVALWFNGTTSPLFGRGDSNNVSNAGLATASSRFATANTLVTTTAPPTLGALTASSVAMWAALS
jgi:hypothetical protein